MKKNIAWWVVAFSAMLISGCVARNQNHGPATLEEMEIEVSDSVPLQLMKLIGRDINLTDTYVKEDGADSIDLSHLAYGAAGYSGVGFFNAAGLTGAFGSMAFSMFMTGSDDPYDQFTFITFTKNGVDPKVELENLLSAHGQIKTIEPMKYGWRGFSYSLSWNNVSCDRAPDKKSDCGVSIYETGINQIDAKDFPKLGLESGQWKASWILVSRSLIDAYMEAASKQANQVTYLYVPPTDGWHTANKVSARYVQKFPYMIDVKNKKALFFVKKRSAD